MRDKHYPYCIGKLCPFFMLGSRMHDPACVGDDCALWIPFTIVDGDGEETEAGHCAMVEIAENAGNICCHDFGI